MSATTESINAELHNQLATPDVLAEAAELAWQQHVAAQRVDGSIRRLTLYSNPNNPASRLVVELRGDDLQQGAMTLFRYNGRQVVPTISTLHRTSDGQARYGVISDLTIRGRDHVRPEDEMSELRMILDTATAERPKHRAALSLGALAAGEIPQQRGAGHLGQTAEG